MSADNSEFDPRVKRTRLLIENAFLELLTETSLSKVTVGDIAARAGVNRGTLYAHFDDKYALFDHTVRKTYLASVKRHLADAAPLNRATLRGLIQATCDYFVYLNAQCPPAERQFRPIAEGQVQAVLYEVLIRWLGDSPEARMQATFLSWAIFGACLQHAGDKCTEDGGSLVTMLDDLAAGVITAYLPGQ